MTVGIWRRLTSRSADERDVFTESGAILSLPKVWERVGLSHVRGDGTEAPDRFLLLPALCAWVGSKIPAEGTRASVAHSTAWQGECGCTKKGRSDRPCNGVPLSCVAWATTAIRRIHRLGNGKPLEITCLEKPSGCFVASPWTGRVSWCFAARAYGLECRGLRNGELSLSRRFTLREPAEQWARELQREIERGWHDSDWASDARLGGNDE